MAFSVFSIAAVPSYAEGSSTPRAATPTFDPEGDTGTVIPILCLEELIVSFHLATGLYPEFPQDIEGDEKVGDALGLRDQEL